MRKLTSGFGGTHGMVAKLFDPLTEAQARVLTPPQPPGTGLNLVDLKTGAITIGELLDLAGAGTFQVCAVEVISGTTPGAGSATVDIALFDGPTQLTGWIPVGTLAFGDAAGTFQKTVGFGGGFAAVANGANWTVGAGLDSVRVPVQAKLRVNVATPFNNATTATLSVYLLAGP